MQSIFKRGVSQPFQTVLTITILGLIANLSAIAEIERWTKLHFSQLQQIVRFRKNRVPSDNTIARILQHFSLDELFTMYPSLKLLTGDAVYAQRPLLERQASFL